MLKYSLIDSSNSITAEKTAFEQKRKRLQKFRLVFVCVLISIALSQNCAQAEVVSPSDSQSQIYAAANYLSNKCGTPIPTPIPIVVEGVQQRNLDLCTIAITRSECPFVSYPFACVLIYANDSLGEIPWYVNFQDIFVKTKIQ
ncbi:hypothetical protein [Leptospira alstonii]|uniref:Uncharacterized protein n=2 Tax=Leptospira alstonii TaxID=28452 RepID=M6DDS0_9LEPT|nr:hypothetical protein [Leptospira alstonii]EMJ96705.1 hypothetical protein LEP1GSC194_4386 [Leptospira alstonii serovar Sichuan str. 79601]EQA78648.1 hypothetical protein LEP1GSC193_1773 [Leptospira alstonii serovar Pingchang str. 80-412]